MATPVFCCGFECGAPNGVPPHFTLGGGTIDTTTKHSGSRSVRMNVTGTADITTTTMTAQARWVGRFYVRFATLPTADIFLANTNDVNGPGVYFKQSDSKIYACVGTTLGASGILVTTNTWYCIDFDFNTNTSGSDTADAQVDGVACPQATDTGVSSEQGNLLFGPQTGGGPVTADIYLDDFILSNTAADYPFGPGEVLPFVPTADGTHNIAGTGDFQRTLTGTDILNATTTAFQLIDDVPLDLDLGVDWINMVLPPNATDYVECIFGPAPGVSTPVIPPRAVEIIAAIHQAGTGAGNMEIRINDNGTEDTMYTATAVAGSVAIVYKRKHYATAIAGGGSWTLSGNGNFNNLRVRFGSPASVDVNPDQYLDGMMIEAEFPLQTSIPSLRNNSMFVML